SEDHAIVAEPKRLARRGAGHCPIGDAEIDDLRHHQFDADWVEDVAERHARTTQICFVVAHPDGVPWRGVHHRDLHSALTDSTLIERPCSSDRGPKTGEACS